MANKTYTEATCDRCKNYEICDGALGGFPLVGWSELELTKRLAGSGWTNNERVEFMLCPDCASEVKGFLSIGKIVNPCKSKSSGVTVNCI